MNAQENAKSKVETPLSPVEQARPYRSIDTDTLLDLIVDEQTKKDLIGMEVENKRFEINSRIASTMASAGYFYAGGEDEKKKMTREQALAKIEIGRAWGLSPADSIRFVYVVNGKPSLENEIYASRMMDAGWSWDVEWIGEQGPACKGVKLWVKFVGKPYVDRLGNQICIEFTEAMAKVAGVLGKSGPRQNYRWNMYFWKAIANLRRFYCPNVLTGALMHQEALELSQLDTYEGEPRKTAPIMEQASEAMKPKSESAAASEEPVDTKQPVDGTKTAETETKQQEKKPKPPTPETLKQIGKMEAELGFQAWAEIMVFSGFTAKVESIDTEIDALGVLSRMKQAREEQIAASKGKK